jgi:short-subunit dehydrogenase
VSLKFSHALVTGAAGAIGGAIARALAAASPGARLSLVDRREEAAAALARELSPNAGAHAFGWDLADVDALPARWDEATRERPVDLLVNCAGVMELRSFTATPWEQGRALIAIDLSSPLRLMSLAAPGMQARGAGAIVNVSSMAGLVPLRGAAYYGAAKAGLALASEIARAELAPSGVHVLTVYPGPVSSELERAARAQLPSSWRTRLVPTGNAEALAALVVRALVRRAPRVVYPPFYSVAERALGLARRVAERLSPAPLD